MIFYC